jgi:hypothetical protein
MSNNHFLNHCHPAEKPKSQEPPAFYEAQVNNQWQGNLEWPLAPDTTNMAFSPNVHLDPPLKSSGTHVWLANCAAVMQAPQEIGSKMDDPVGPIIQPHHGAFMRQLPPFPPYQTLQLPSVFPTVEASYDLAGGQWSGYQGHSTTESALSQKALMQGLAEAQHVASNNAFHIPSLYPSPYGNQIHGSLETFATTNHEKQELQRLPENFRGSYLASGHINRQDVEIGTSIVDTMHGLSTESDLVCFGMLVGIPGTCERACENNATSHPVKLESPDTFVGTEDHNLRGHVSPDVRFLTAPLIEENSIELQVTCNVSVDASELLKKRKRLRPAASSLKCALDIILYGPIRAVDSICTFIDKCNEYLDDNQKIYLQDPVRCDRNVRYCNPQRLPPLDPGSIQLTSDLEIKRQQLVKIEAIELQTDLLELLDSQEDLPEAPQPPAITTLLQRQTRLRPL